MTRFTIDQYVPNSRARKRSPNKSARATLPYEPGRNRFVRCRDDQHGAVRSGLPKVRNGGGKVGTETAVEDDRIRRERVRRGEGPRERIRFADHRMPEGRYDTDEERA